MRITAKLNGLLSIIDRHSMGDNFRIHSLHRHTMLPNGTIRLETDAGKTGYKWANAMPITDVDLAQVHPTFFKFHDGALVPFEFAQGPLPVAVDAIPAAFLSEFVQYLVQHQLADMIALELGSFASCRRQKDSATAEIEVQWGDGGEPFTLCVSAKEVLGVDGKESRLIPTGWNVPATNPSGVQMPAPETPDPGTYWQSKTVKGVQTHMVFVGGGNGRNSSNLVTPELVVKELVGMGIIRG